MNYRHLLANEKGPSNRFSAKTVALVPLAPVLWILCVCCQLILLGWAPDRLSLSSMAFYAYGDAQETLPLPQGRNVLPMLLRSSLPSGSDNATVMMMKNNSPCNITADGSIVRHTFCRNISSSLSPSSSVCCSYTCAATPSSNVTAATSSEAMPPACPDLLAPLNVSFLESTAVSASLTCSSTDAHVAIQTVRVGIVTDLGGIVGTATRWGIDGFIAGLHEFNAQQRTRFLRQELLLLDADASSSHAALTPFRVYRQVQLIVNNTFDVASDVPAIVDGWMAHNDTRVDALALVVGPEHVQHARTAAERHNIPLIGSLSGERWDFTDFSANSLLAVPSPDAELAALVEEAVKRRGWRRIAIIVSTDYSFGNTLVPYLRTLLGRLGLQLVMVLDSNPKPTPQNFYTYATAQVRAFSAADVQAVLLYGALSFDTIQLLIQIMLLPNPHVGILCPVSTLPMVDLMLQSVSVNPRRIITTLYFPLPTDARFALTASFRRAYDTAERVRVYAHMENSSSINSSAGVIAGDNCSSLLGPVVRLPLSLTQRQHDTTASVASNMAMAGYVGARFFRALVDDHQDSPRAVTAASLLKTAFSRRAFVIDDIIIGPFSPRCDDSGNGMLQALHQTAKDGQTCACHSGARAVFLAAYNDDRRLEALPESRYSFEAGECYPYEPRLDSPLVQLMVVPLLSAPFLSPGVNSSRFQLWHRAMADYIGGDQAGHQGATVVPSTRTATYLQANISSVEDLADTVYNRIVTLVTGSVLPGNIQAAIASSDRARNRTAGPITEARVVTIDVLSTDPFPKPQWKDSTETTTTFTTGETSSAASFQRDAIQLLSTLEQEIHALCAYFCTADVVSSLGPRGMALLSAAPTNIRQLVEQALVSSLNSFGIAAPRRVVSASTVAAGLESLGKEAVATGRCVGPLLLHGIDTTADIDAMVYYLRTTASIVSRSSGTSNAEAEEDCVVVLPFEHLRLWYPHVVQATARTSSMMEGEAQSQQQEQEDAEAQQQISRLRARIVFATNLPNWNLHQSINTSSSIVQGIVSEYIRGMNSSTTVSSSSSSSSNNSSQFSSSGISSSPQQLLGFVTQRFIAAIAERIPGALSAATFLDMLYAVGTVSIDPSTLVFGPFSDVSCASSALQSDRRLSAAASSSSSLSSLSTSDSTLCESNTGARSVHLFTLDTVTTTAATATATTPTTNASSVSANVRLLNTVVRFGANGRVLYTPLPTTDNASLLGIPIGALVGLVVVTSLLIVSVAGLGIRLLRHTWQLRARGHHWAPKDPSKPVTIVFTDIQSSTALWAEVPEVMAPALEAHNTIIRKAIHRHNGYEVKTIGDAFMVAFGSADDAVAFAADVQRKLFEESRAALRQSPLAKELPHAADVLLSVIDEAYLENEAAAVDSEISMQNTAMDMNVDSPFQSNNHHNHGNNTKIPASLAGLSIFLTPEAYVRSWCGLRVRIGIHTGVANIQLDPVSQSYDYHGPAVNLAARVEAAGHGGQVLLTDAVVGALRRSQLQTVDILSPRTSLPSSSSHHSASDPIRNSDDSSNHHHHDSNDHDDFSDSEDTAGNDKKGCCCSRRTLLFFASGKKYKLCHFHAKPLGNVLLRGIATATSLFQLQTAPKRRTYPPLRTDKHSPSTSVVAAVASMSTAAKGRQATPHGTAAAGSPHGASPTTRSEDGSNNASREVSFPNNTSSASSPRRGASPVGQEDEELAEIAPGANQASNAVILAVLSALFAVLPTEAEKRSAMERCAEWWHLPVASITTDNDKRRGGRRSRLVDSYAHGAGGRRSSAGSHSSGGGGGGGSSHHSAGSARMVPALVTSGANPSLAPLVNAIGLRIAPVVARHLHALATRAIPLVLPVCGPNNARRAGLTETPARGGAGESHTPRTPRGAVAGEAAPPTIEIQVASIAHGTGTAGGAGGTLTNTAARRSSSNSSAFQSTTSLLHLYSHTVTGSAHSHTPRDDSLLEAPLPNFSAPSSNQSLHPSPLLHPQRTALHLPPPLPTTTRPQMLATPDGSYKIEVEDFQNKSTSATSSARHHHSNQPSHFHNPPRRSSFAPMPNDAGMSYLNSASCSTVDLPPHHVAGSATPDESETSSSLAMSARGGGGGGSDDIIADHHRHRAQHQRHGSDKGSAADCSSNQNNNNNNNTANVDDIATSSGSGHENSTAIARAVSVLRSPQHHTQFICEVPPGSEVGVEISMDTRKKS